MKKTTKQIEQQILQENQSFYEDITQKHYGSKYAPKRKILWASSAIAVVCLVFISVFLPQLIGQQPPRYLVENEVSTPTTMQAMQQEVDYIDIVAYQSKYNLYVTRCYDKISNDTLYFQVRLEDVDGIETYKMYLYFNKDYIARQHLVVEPTGQTTINNLPWSYAVESEMVSQGVYNHTVMAEQQSEKFSIYVEYSQVSAGEQHGFVAFVQRVLVVK